MLLRVGGENKDKLDRGMKPTGMTEMFQDWIVMTIA